MQDCWGEFGLGVVVAELATFVAAPSPHGVTAVSCCDEAVANCGVFELHPTDFGGGEGCAVAPDVDFAFVSDAGEGQATHDFASFLVKSYLERHTRRPFVASAELAGFAFAPEFHVLLAANSVNGSSVSGAAAYAEHAFNGHNLRHQRE